MNLIIKDIPEILKLKIDNDASKLDAIDLAILIGCVADATPIPDNASILSVTEFADKCRECGKNYVKIPDNATNGDVIKAIFPQWKLMENTFEEMVLFDIPMKDGYLEHNACSREWWNAPYQKGGKDE